ncbi:hypothetical protein GUJ93_ZPchr0001g29388 [Zizania palustris]|uniref:Uncharacterized protein n=1 Tax=Zizania palustris TaxID=103762 RepID=A0A8J5VP62_ZIZPA|nr:hypothetical protein GUJ93_ZPchr0001g29388 [Zizania palustris]
MVPVFLLLRKGAVSHQCCTAAASAAALRARVGDRATPQRMREHVGCVRWPLAPRSGTARRAREAGGTRRLAGSGR